MQTIANKNQQKRTVGSAAAARVSAQPLLCGLTARAANMMPTATTAVVIAAFQWPAAARPAVAAQAMDEKASAKVATRDEVCRRRNCLRLAWVRNQSWISVAEMAAIVTPVAAASASRGEASASAATKGAKMSATLPATASILARTIQPVGIGAVVTRSGASSPEMAS